MSVTQTVYHAGIPVDLAAPSRQQIGTSQFFYGDNRSHVFTALVGDTDHPEAGLRSGAVTGAVLRKDGTTVVLAGEKGTATVPTVYPNGKAANATACSVTLPQECFAIPGPILITIKLVDGETVTSVLNIGGTVIRTETDSAVDPGEIIPDVSTLAASARAALAAAEEANTAAAGADTAAAAAEEATGRVDAAITDAESAAESAYAAVDDATAAANEAYDKAQAANTAAQAANTAATAAGTAATAADTAADNADDAARRANAANVIATGAAQLAQTAASDANTAASDANTAAQAAGTEADAAHTQAMGAATAAQNARSAASQAVQASNRADNSATAADTAASSATTAASSATTAADAANEAADFALDATNQATYAASTASSAAVRAETAANAAQAAMSGAVRFDAAQALTDAQKAQARANIGAEGGGGGSVEGAVRYDVVQALSTAQQEQARGNVGAAGMASVAEIKNLQPEPILSGTYSGTRTVSIYENIPAGDYHLSVESVTSTDTDKTTSCIGFMTADASTVYLEIQLPRNTRIELDFTLPSSIARIMLYASSDYPKGADDTFTFTGLKISGAAYPLLANIHDTIYPVLSGDYSGTRNVSLIRSFPEGEYFIQIDSITSADTDSTQSLISFTNLNNTEKLNLLFLRNRPQFLHVHMPADVQKVLIMASYDYAHGANDAFTYKGLRIWKVNENLLDNRQISTPAGFGWTGHPLVGYLHRTESGIECNLDVKAFRPASGYTYYVSPTGNDSNAGTSSSAPLQSIATAMGKSNAVFIRLMDGYYDGSLVPGHISGLSHNLAVVADTNAHPVIGSSNGASTWTQTSGKTYTYQTTADSNAVWDIGNAMAYSRVDSANDVESTAASYYCDGTATYVHTKDGSAPTSDIRCCLASDNFRVTFSGKRSLYLEGLTIVGGDAGAFRATCDGTNRPNVYAKDCAFIGAVSWGACYLEGCESILQNCEAYGSKADGFGIHRNNTTNTVSPRHIEINCHGHHNGVTGNTTSNGSTAHASAYVIRVNGNYHHNVGPNVADVHNGTEVWNLGCHAWASLLGLDTAGNSDFLPSDGSVKMWLDNCSGYGSKQSLCVNNLATAYVRGGVFETVKVNEGGHMESY